MRPTVRSLDGIVTIKVPPEFRTFSNRQRPKPDYDRYSGRELLDTRRAAVASADDCRGTAVLDHDERDTLIEREGMDCWGLLLLFERFDHAVQIQTLEGFDGRIGQHLKVPCGFNRQW